MATMVWQKKEEKKHLVPLILHEDRENRSLDEIIQRVSHVHINIGEIRKKQMIIIIIIIKAYYYNIQKTILKMFHCRYVHLFVHNKSMYSIGALIHKSG